MKYVFLVLFIAFAIIFSSCTVNNAKVDNGLKKYFDSANVDGCFSLLDNATGEITVYNMKLDTQRILPASTFEIVNALIGLETNKILDEKMVIKSDTINSESGNQGKDLNLEQAFKVSFVPYFQEVARRIGRDTMKYWIDSLHYGNMDISGPIDSFWLNNTLKISPDEQLGLVNRLYFDMLPFEKRSQDIVQNLMLRENNTLYKFSYKTGWGYDEQHNLVGWVVGWIEENRHFYPFVTLVKSTDKNLDMQKASMDITKGILTGMGFFKGEK